MSLINPRNFVVPLQNKFNVGLIIVIAVLIAAMRLSGGRVALDPAETPRARLRPAATTSDSKPARPSAEAKAPAKSAANPQNDELLDQLLASEPVPAKRADPRNVSGPKKTGDFNDIRKSLGLE